MHINFYFLIHLFYVDVPHTQNTSAYFVLPIIRFLSYYIDVPYSILSYVDVKNCHVNVDLCYCWLAIRARQTSDIPENQFILLGSFSFQLHFSSS